MIFQKLIAGGNIVMNAAGRMGNFFWGHTRTMITEHMLAAFFAGNADVTSFLEYRSTPNSPRVMKIEPMEYPFLLTNMK